MSKEFSGDQLADLSIEPGEWNNLNYSVLEWLNIFQILFLLIVKLIAIAVGILIAIAIFNWMLSYRKEVGTCLI